MDSETLSGLVRQMRNIGGEPTEIEAKSSAGGYPKSAVDSMVAFANTAGGTLLLGIDEESGFSVVGVDKPAHYRDTALQQAENSIDPPIHIDVEFLELEGKQIVVIEVPEAAPHQKPVHLKTKGPSTGSLIRSGDGDRRMTPAEIGLLYASRTQPLDDKEPVPSASVEELDLRSVRRTLERIRNGSAAMRLLEDGEMMRRLNITVDFEGKQVPTLAGLLTFSDFPQQHFPQLMVSFVVLGDGTSDERFVDNVTIRGSIPSMVAESVAAVRRHLNASTIVTSAGRKERLDYSMTAVREAVVNALLHRDYSPITRGTQVHLELFPDRLVVRNPGGLYGPISEDALGSADTLSSSRNSILASLLSDTYMPVSDRLVAENRSTGIRTIIDEAKALGQNRPVFKSIVTQFTVTMNRSELLGPETRVWLSAIGGPFPTPIYDIALAMMRADYVTNEMLRQWGVDRIQAGAVLKDLVNRGLAVKEGGRKYAHYVLAAGLSVIQNTERDAQPLSSAPDGDLRAAPRVALSIDDQRILDLLTRRGSLGAAEISATLGLVRGTTINRLNDLVAAGRVEAEGAPRSPKRSYHVKLDAR